MFGYDIPVSHLADFKIFKVAGTFDVQVQIGYGDNDGGDKGAQAYYSGNRPMRGILRSLYRKPRNFMSGVLEVFFIVCLYYFFYQRVTHDVGGMEV